MQSHWRDKIYLIIHVANSVAFFLEFPHHRTFSEHIGHRAGWLSVHTGVHVCVLCVCPHELNTSESLCLQIEVEICWVLPHTHWQVNFLNDETGYCGITYHDMQNPESIILRWETSTCQHLHLLHPVLPHESVYTKINRQTQDHLSMLECFWELFVKLEHTLKKSYKWI